MKEARIRSGLLKPRAEEETESAQLDEAGTVALLNIIMRLVGHLDPIFS
jgi:hypothetical protein